MFWSAALMLFPLTPRSTSKAVCDFISAHISYTDQVATGENQCGRYRLLHQRTSKRQQNVVSGEALTLCRAHYERARLILLRYPKLASTAARLKLLNSLSTILIQVPRS